MGRDPTSRFLSKTRLKKPYSNEVYTDKDLKIGESIDVYGREFFLYDADEFTRNYLDEQYGKHDWTPINVDERASKASISKKIPPYNGWGSEEDSLGFVFSLHPKPPRKDIVKLVGKDGQILRFLAKLKNPQFQDRNRIFAICFYLSDDTISIYEKFIRNSGFSCGRFLIRNKYKNEAAGGRYFEASDFAVGREYTINKFTFITYDADDYAMNYEESLIDEFPQSDLSDILQPYLHREEIHQNLRDIFEKLDPNLHGFVPEKDAERIVAEELGMDLHSTKTLVRRFMTERGFDYFALIVAMI